VAGWAEIQCRISYIPGEGFDEVKNQVEQAVNDIAHGDEWLRQHPPEITWLGWKADPWEQNPDDPFVVTFRTCAEEVLGSSIDIVGKTGGLDTRFAQYFGIPALSVGPSGENYHGVNEYGDLDSLVDCVKIFVLFIMEWCGCSAIGSRIHME